MSITQIAATPWTRSQTDRREATFADTLAVLGFAIAGAFMSALVLRWLGPENTGMVHWVTLFTQA